MNHTSYCCYSDIICAFTHLDQCLVLDQLMTKFLLWGQCRAAGMDDYLSKPINCDLLYATIKKWLNSEVAHHADVVASRIFCNN